MINKSLAEYMANLDENTAVSPEPINNNYGSFANSLQRASQVEYTPVDPRTISKFNPISESLATYARVVNPLEERTINTDTTLGGLASIYGSTPTNIQTANPQIKDFSKIYAGTNINVPTNNDLGLTPAQIDRLVQLETTNGKYDEVNNRSGAYGRYQIMPDTAKYYAGKIGVNYENWKTPENQDKLFAAITKDNLRQLKNKNLGTDLFSIYGAHQQGVTGFSNIMNNKLNPQLEKNMRGNLPDSYKSLKGQDLRDAWVSYWKDKTNMEGS
jgi:muramidase (phage lysozyme)